MKDQKKKNSQEESDTKRRRKIDLDQAYKQEVKIINKQKQQEEKSRSKRIGKPYNQIRAELQEKKHKGDSVKTFAFCLGVIIIVFLVYMYIEYGQILGLSIYKNNNLDNAKKIDIVSTDQDIYRQYNSDIIVYSNQIVKLYDTSAKDIFEFKLPEAFTPEIYSNNSYMMVVNKAKGIIYYFLGKDEILDKKIDGTVNAVYIDNDGNFALEYSASGYKKVVGVYDKSGNNLYNAYLDSNAILDIKLLNEGKKLIIAQVTTDSLTVGVSIKQIDGTKTNDNIKEIINLKNATLYNLTIKGQNIIMLLDSGIELYNIDTAKQSTIKSFDKLQASFIDINNNYYSIIEDKADIENTNNHNYAFETTEYDSKSLGNTSLQNIPKYIKSGKLIACLIYQDKLQVINKWCKVVKDIKIAFPPKDDLIFNNEKNLALIYSNKIYILNI